MPYSREERDLMNKIVNNIKQLSEDVQSLNDRLLEIQGFIDSSKFHPDFRTLSKKEIEDTIQAAVQSIIKRTNVPLHTHLDNINGGPAFASKGARLVDNTNT